MNRMQLRQLIRENREAELAQRKEAARLARMNPRVRREVALEQLNDPNAEDWQRGAIADILGFEGQTPLGVDQRALEGAWRLAQAALQNESTNPLQDAQADMATRAQAPALAGMRDLEAGDFQSAEAQTFVNNLAERFDTQAGGFSLQDEQRLAEHLQQRYNMPQDEAERMAYVAGNNRRWLKSSGPAPANPAGQSLPRSPSAQPPRESGQRVPPRQGGRRGGAPSQPFQFPESGGGRGRGGSRPGVPPR